VYLDGAAVVASDRGVDQHTLAGDLACMLVKIVCKNRSEYRKKSQNEKMIK